MVARYRQKRNVPRYRPAAKKPDKTDGSYVAFDGTKCTAKRATTFTTASVKKLKPPAEGQVEFFQKLERGLTLVLRLSYGGTKAWRVVYYVGSRARAKTIGRYPHMDVVEARKAAYAFDPRKADAAADAGTFKEVAEKWLKQYVAKKKLRSQYEIERTLRTYIYPEWERQPFFEIRRKMVNDLLDRIEDKHGAPTADGVLATVRSICNWYATRDENYSTPIVKGMKRDLRQAKERERKRTLDDNEIRVVWHAADDAGAFGAIVKLLLLTGQRRAKVNSMRWADVDLETGDWTIPSEPREKGNGGKLKLPQVALDIVKAQPEIDGNPFVFSGSLHGRRHKSAASKDEPPTFNSWTQRKAELDAAIKNTLPDMPHWTPHDLRRTARSLLPRTGVKEEVAEHLIGHAIPGVKGIYNRYEYYEEKADALDRLAKLIETIVNPPPEDRKVIHLPTHAGA